MLLCSHDRTVLGGVVLDGLGLIVVADTAVVAVLPNLRPASLGTVRVAVAAAVVANTSSGSVVAGVLAVVATPDLWTEQRACVRACQRRSVAAKTCLHRVECFEILYVIRVVQSVSLLLLDHRATINQTTAEFRRSSIVFKIYSLLVLVALLPLAAVLSLPALFGLFLAMPVRLAVLAPLFNRLPIPVALPLLAKLAVASLILVVFIAVHGSQPPGCSCRNGFFGHFEDNRHRGLVTVMSANGKYNTLRGTSIAGI